MPRRAAGSSPAPQDPGVGAHGGRRRIVAERRQIRSAARSSGAGDVGERTVDRLEAERRAAAIDGTARGDIHQGTAKLPQQRVDPRRKRLRAHDRRRRRPAGHHARTVHDVGVGHVTPFSDRGGRRLQTGADDDFGAGARRGDRGEERGGEVHDVAPLPADRLQVRPGRPQRLHRVDAVRLGVETARANPADKIRRHHEGRAVAAAAQRDGEREHRLYVAARAVRSEKHAHLCILPHHAGNADMNLAWISVAALALAIILSCVTTINVGGSRSRSRGSAGLRRGDEGRAVMAGFPTRCS